MLTRTKFRDDIKAMTIRVTCRDEDGEFKTFACDVPNSATDATIDVTDYQGMRAGKLVWSFFDNEGILHHVYGELLDGS